MGCDHVGAEGEEFGPYRLRFLLGRGAMGEVWHAFDTRRERDVALKRLGASVAADPEVQARFRQEARVTARLSSLHVIPIHDFGEIDGRLFVDMRLVPGGDLARALREHPAGLPPHRAVDIVTQIADALDAAHAAGLVHRDVKPSNVLVAEHRGRDFCYLVDFGIARLVGPTAPGSLTSTGVVLGTTAYMAPELFSGTQATARSDVYALGCVLYEALTGQQPFPGPDAVTHMSQHVHAEVPAPSQVRAELSGFDRVVTLALAKDPERRFPGAEALAAAALGVLSTPTTGRTPIGGPATVGGPTVVGPPPIGFGASALGHQPAAGGGPSTGGPNGPVSTGFSAAPGHPTTTSGAAWTDPARLPPPHSGPPTGTGARTPAPTGAPTGASPAAPAAATVAMPPAALPAPPLAEPAEPRQGWRRAVAWLVGALVAAGIVVGSVLAVDYLLGTGTLTTPPAPTALAANPVPGTPQNPRWVDVSPDGSRAYVTGSTPGAPVPHAVSVLDTTDNSVVATFPIGTFPGDLTVSPDGRRVYLSERGTDAQPGNALTAIDASNGAVVARTVVGLAPSGVALRPDGAVAYVADEGTNATPGSTVSVVDTGTGAVVATVGVGQGPSRVAASPDGRKVYVANEGVRTGVGNTVSVIDTATNAVTTTIRVGETPRSIAFSADGRVAYVANQGTLRDPRGSISVIDAASDTVTGTLTDRVAGPIGIAVSADGRTALVTNYGSAPAPGSSVTVLDTATNAVTGTLAVGTKPLSVAGTPDGHHAYVTTGTELWLLDVPG